MRDVGVVFFSTIKSSVEVAQRGLDVSRDAITIFRAILDGESIEEIREFVALTRKRTMTVYNKSKHVSSRFQDVGIGLGKVGHFVKLDAHQLLTSVSDIQRNTCH